jgi:hypothetical protein
LEDIHYQIDLSTASKEPFIADQIAKSGLYLELIKEIKVKEQVIIKTGSVVKWICLSIKNC